MFEPVVLLKVNQSDFISIPEAVKNRDGRPPASWAAINHPLSIIHYPFRQYEDLFDTAVDCAIRTP
jgi:hypothetical protein